MSNEKRRLEAKDMPIFEAPRPQGGACGTLAGHKFEEVYRGEQGFTKSFLGALGYVYFSEINLATSRGQPMILVTLHLIMLSS